MVDVIISLSLHLGSKASYLYFKTSLALENQYNKTIVLQLDPTFPPLDDGLLHIHIFQIT